MGDWAREALVQQVDVAPPGRSDAGRKEKHEIRGKVGELWGINGCEGVGVAGEAFAGGSGAATGAGVAVAAFAACPCPVFLAPGNHDPLSAASPYRTERWPVNVHIFASRAISPVELPEQHCRVFGAGFESAYASGLLGGFSAPQDGWVNVMVLHGDALNPNSPYNAVTKEQIAASGLRYLALGHIHQASGLLRAGHTAYAWPGCAMGRGVDELGEKGAYLVTLTDSDCSLEFLPLGGRSYEILRVPAGDDAAAALDAALPPDAARDIYRVILTGVVSECCVLSTFFEGIDLGCKLIWLTDATSGLNPVLEEETLHILQGLSPLHVEFLSTEDYLSNR